MRINSNSLANNIPPVVKHLLAVNILMFVATNVLEQLQINLVDLLGLHFWQSSKFHFWQLFTYMFMHGGISHLFFNMFSLWMFGMMLERVIGSRCFLFFYIVCGLGAGLVQELMWQMTWLDTVGSMLADGNGNRVILNADQVSAAIRSGQLNQSLLSSIIDNMITIGASGSIFGILIAFAWFFPNVPLYLFFIPIPIKAKWFVLIYGAVELFFGVHGIMDNVAHFAHLGGLLFGLIILIYWKLRGTINGNII